MQSQDIHVIAQPITDQLDQDHFLEPDIDQEVIEVFDTGEEGQDQYQTPPVLPAAQPAQDIPQLHLSTGSVAQFNYHGNLFTLHVEEAD